MTENVDLTFCIQIAGVEAWLKVCFFLSKSFWHFEATKGEFELGRHEQC